MRKRIKGQANYQTLPAAHTTHTTKPQGNTPTHLKVYNDGKHKNSGHEARQVWQVLAVECFPQTLDLVRAGGQEVEEGNDGTFKFCASAGVDGGRTERLPHDGLTDVGGDEEGDAGTKPVTLLKELIQEEDNKPCTHKLSKQKERGGKVWWWSQRTNCCRANLAAS